MEAVPSARPPPLDLAPERRPGVPMQPGPKPAAGAHEPPGRQPVRERILHRAGLPQLPPVFGTAQPPRGVSGLLRRVAYAIPETRARHWMLLIVADRADVWEHRLLRPAFWAWVAVGVGAGLGVRRLRRARS